MNEIHEKLKSALAVARGDPKAALTMLEEGLENARMQGDLAGVATLARHAGAIATNLHDLDSASRFYEEALKCAPDDAGVHVALGDIWSSMGDPGRARSSFDRALELAKLSGDQDGMTLASGAIARLKD